MARERWLGAALALLLCCAARAGDAIQVGEIVARGWSPWPDGLNKGEYPIFVELRNTGTRARSIDLRANCSDYSARRDVRKTIELEPGQATRVELLAPLMSTWNSWGLTVSVGHGADTGWISDVGMQRNDQRYRGVLVIAANPPPVGAKEQWSAKVSTLSVGGPRYVSSGTAAASAGTNDDIQFGVATFDEMPAAHSAYSSLDLALLDTRGGMPSSAQIEPLVAWVRLGGELLMVGPRALEFARAEPQLKPWIEPRFLSEGEHVDTYQCGFGHVEIDSRDADLFEDLSQRDVVRALVMPPNGLVPDPSGSRVARAQPAIAGLGEIPHRWFSLLLVVFALVIGPVNFFAVKRSKKPVMLLVTIPAIAVSTSILLLIYGVFVQGLDVKTASCSATLLDQREHRSDCVEKRLMFAGLSPAAGLRPDVGTAVFAVASDSPEYSAAMRIGARQQITLISDQSQGRTLSGDYLPTRVPVMQVIHSDRAARGRLDVRVAGEAFTVENGLGVGVRALVLRDLHDRYFQSNGPIAAGARAELTAMPVSQGASSALTLLREPIGACADYAPQPLALGCYAAEIDAGVFRDDCGIETNEKSSTHRVLGVLSADEAEWR